MTAERDALRVAREYVAPCKYHSERARAHLAQIDAALSQPQASPIGDWWFVVDKDGFTYRCVDQVDAPIYVDMFNKVCPKKSPYHVVQLYEVAPGVGAAQDWERQSMAILADSLKKRGDDLSTDSASWLRKFAAAPQPAQPNQIALSPEKDAEFQRVIEQPVPVPVAWMHTVTQDDGDPDDQALSFLPDNFPLSDNCGFRSKGSVPLYATPPDPAPDTFTPDEYEFQVWQDDNVQASGSGSREDVITEANHYAAMYSQDGPVTIKYFARADVTARLVGEQGEKTT